MFEKDELTNQEAIQQLLDAGFDDQAILGKLQSNHTLRKSEFIKLREAWSKTDARKYGIVLVVGYDDD